MSVVAVKALSQRNDVEQRGLFGLLWRLGEYEREILEEISEELSISSGR